MSQDDRTDATSYDRTGDVRMSSSRIVGLIARREILSRLKDKGFILSSVFIIVLIMGSVVFQVLVQSGADDASVGIVGGPQDLPAAIEAQADALGVSAQVREYDDADAARQAVADEDIDAAVIDGETVIVNESLGDRLRAALNGAVTGLAVAERLVEEGIDPSVLQPVSLDVTSLQPEAETAAEKAVVAFVSILLLYTLLLFFGQFIAQGVVEEKASRVIEVLLAAVKPWQLLAGKIIGLGVLGFGQLVIICAAGLGGAIAFGVITVPAAAIWTVVQVLGWFILGFALVAAVFAVAGALVSRQEDLQTVLLPTTLVLVAALVLAITAGQNPNGGLATVTSYIPPLSTMVMPVRVATGTVQWWEIALAVALLLVAIVAVVRVGGRVYSGALLRKGGRVKIKDALNAERAS